MSSYATTASRLLKSRKFWHELLVMTLGIMLASAAIYYFLVPTNVVTGSVSGFAIFLTQALAPLGIELKVPTIVLIVNVFLIILAIATLGKDFGAKTIYTSIMMGPLMDLFDRICPYTRFLTEPGQTSIMGDIWLDMLCLALLLGLSQAVLFRINASTGGLDIIGKIINKYLHLDIGTSVSIAGYIICALGFFVTPFRLVAIGLVVTWLNGVTIDYFTAGLNKKKRVCIICDEYDDIRQYIINGIHRGCSLYTLKGGYREEEHVEIQALLTQTEFAELMEYIRDHNYKAFITAGNVNEVYGYWKDNKSHKAKNQKLID